MPRIARFRERPVSPVHNHGPAEGRGLACGEAMVDGKLRGHCLDAESEWFAGIRVNPYEWRSEVWPRAAVSVSALRSGGAEVRVTVGNTFMGHTLTGEQAAAMGAVLIEFSRNTPDSRTTRSTPTMLSGCLTRLTTSAVSECSYDARRRRLAL